MDEMKLERRKRVQRLRYSLREMEDLAYIASLPQYQTLRRVIFRFIRNLRDASYKLPETDAHYLAIRHAGYAGQGLGARQVISMLDNSDRKLEDIEEKVEKVKNR